MARIHATAIVDPGARLADTAIIGPYCVVGPDVVLDDKVELKSHVVVEGITTIGAGSTVYPFSSLGQAPQNIRYRGEPTRLEIGRNNIIREQVTMNTGTVTDAMVTRIGDDNMFMIGAHVGHDCQVGSNVVLANQTLLGGHAVVGDFVILGGRSAIHQNVRVGQHAIVGAFSAVVRDVIPFGRANGDRAALDGINLIGLRRRGFPRTEIDSLSKLYQNLFSDEGIFEDRIAKAIKDFVNPCGPVDAVLAFVQSKGNRGLCKPKPADVA